MKIDYYTGTYYTIDEPDTHYGDTQEEARAMIDKLTEKHGEAPQLIMIEQDNERYIYAYTYAPWECGPSRHTYRMTTKSKEYDEERFIEKSGQYLNSELRFDTSSIDTVKMTVQGHKV